MPYRALADLVVAVHLCFILFVVFGGYLALRWPRLGWLQVPSALWGAAIEFTGGVCPLTPLEQYLRRLGGEAGYAGGFVEHYITAIIYPEGLTRTTQLVLGSLVVLINAVAYGLVLRRRGTSHHGGGSCTDHS